MNRVDEEHRSAAFTPEKLTYLHESIMEEIRALHEAAPAPSLTMPQFRVLCIVSRRGSITPGELAALLRVTAPTVTDIVNRMTASGLLVRERCESDRRVVRLSPTPRGEALLREFFAQRSHIHLSLFGSLDDEQRNTVGRGLEELLAAVRRYRRDGPDEGPGPRHERLAVTEHDRR